MSTIEPKIFTLKNGESITIRTGIKSDAGPLLPYLDALLEDGEGMVLEAGEMPKTLEEEEAWVCGMLDHPNEILLLAEHAGKIIGNLDFHVGKRRRLRHGGMFGIGVLPGWRAHGVGTALLRSFIDWAWSRKDIERISLYVLGSNARAIALYKKFGFLEEGRQPNEVKLGADTYVDNVLMGRSLNRR